jgi:hypothetical protein
MEGRPACACGRIDKGSRAWTPSLPNAASGATKSERVVLPRDLVFDFRCVVDHDTRQWFMLHRYQIFALVLRSDALAAALCLAHCQTISHDWLTASQLLESQLGRALVHYAVQDTQ